MAVGYVVSGFNRVAAGISAIASYVPTPVRYYISKVKKDPLNTCFKPFIFCGHAVQSFTPISQTFEKSIAAVKVAKSVGTILRVVTETPTALDAISTPIDPRGEVIVDKFIHAANDFREEDARKKAEEAKKRKGTWWDYVPSFNINTYLPTALTKTPIEFWPKEVKLTPNEALLRRFCKNIAGWSAYVSEALLEIHHHFRPLSTRLIQVASWVGVSAGFATSIYGLYEDNLIAKAIWRDEKDCEKISLKEKRLNIMDLGAHGLGFVYSGIGAAGLYLGKDAPKWFWIVQWGVLGCYALAQAGRSILKDQVMEKHDSN